MLKVGAPARALLTWKHARTVERGRVGYDHISEDDLLPVQGDVVLGVVGDADDDAVAFPGDDLGAGELPVHRDDALARAQTRHVRHCHLRARGI